MNRFWKCFVLVLTLAAVLMLPSCAGEKVGTDIEDYDVTLPAEQLLTQVKKNDFVVHEDGDVVSGQELWQTFYETVQSGKPASIKLANYYEIDRDRVSPEYYEENKDDYPVIYLAELTFDGEVFIYRSINGQDGVNGFTRTYRYLMRYEEIPGAQATFTFCERYVLVQDNTLTYERIQAGLVSSRLGDYIDHKNVYRDYEYKPEYQ